MAYEERSKNTATVHQELRRPHSLTLEERKKLSISGVTDVESFDENEIVMETGGGCLIIRGEDLSISKLSVDNGDVNVQGRISELHYEESAPRQSLWERLFR